MSAGAWRRTAVLLVEDAGSPPGLKGFAERLKLALTRGMLVRQDVSEDVLRLPASQTQWRYPSPGSQKPPVVPQGKYENVFDIAYYKRDSRRVMTAGEVSVEGPVRAGPPPTPGNAPQSFHLGYAGDFDIRRD